MVLKNKKKFNRELKIGLSLVSLYFFWALIWLIYSYFIKGHFSKPYYPEINISQELLFPLTNGPVFGSDIYGRSLFEVLSSGLIYSLGISFFVSFLSCSFGMIMGYLSLVGKRQISFFINLSIDLIFVFPSILIAILFMAVIGESFWALVFCLTFTQWPSYARISRGEIQRVLSLSYVESSKAVGMGFSRLFLKIIIPEIMPQLSIHFVLGLSGVIITEATLGFLGLGVSEYSWGVILSMAKTVLLEAPFIIGISGIVMAGMIMASNLLGDGLRDYLDVKKV